MLSASDWKAAFRHWPNTNHWLPSIVDPFILEIRAPPPCFSPYARQGLAKSLGFIDGPWLWKGAASFVSRLLINGPLWPVFSSQFLPVAMSFPVSFDLLMRPILVHSLSFVSLPIGATYSQIFRPRIDDLCTVSHPTDLYRFHARNSRTDGRVGFRETLMVRVRISIACALEWWERYWAMRWLRRAAPFCARN